MDIDAKNGDNGRVGFVVLSANHHDDLDDVERLASRSEDVRRDITATAGVQGAVVLSTCNRFEVYLDAEEAAVEPVRQVVLGPDSHVSLNTYLGLDAARHVYEVATGLDSMVVGEREIVGQVRGALNQARREGTTSPLLEQTLQGALRTSRTVAVQTDISHAGRSIVAVALDLAGNVACERSLYTWEETGGPTVPPTDWSGIRVLLVGTGAYAGASAAALAERGADNVRVWSKSGRGEKFAADHGIDYSPELDLAWPDVIVLCRGTGSPVLTADMVAEAMKERGPLTLIDLALSRDVEKGAGEMENVTLIDLDIVRRHVPAAARGDVERAHAIIAEGLTKLDAELLGRTMDPLVVTIRNMFAMALEKELHRLPAAGEIPAEDAVRALQRLTASIAYHPTAAAQRAAKHGRGKEYHAAAEVFLGLELPQPKRDVFDAAEPCSYLTEHHCVCSHSSTPACPRLENRHA